MFLCFNYDFDATAINYLEKLVGSWLSTKDHHIFLSSALSHVLCVFRGSSGIQLLLYGTETKNIPCGSNVFFHESYFINVIVFLPSIIDISNYSTIDSKIPEYLDIRIDLIVFEARDQGRG